MNYKKENYNRIVNLFMINEVLVNKEDKIEYLIESCKNEDEKDLIFSLLERLIILNNSKYNILLNSMVDYISDLNLNHEQTQIAAMAIDHAADSSQTVLQAIKHKLTERNFNDFITVNNFNKTIHFYHQDKVNIIIVDEFIGSGKTVLNRIKVFKERITPKEPYNIHFVFLAGMDYAINRVRDEGINIFCAYPLKRGITDNYPENELEKILSLMLELELRLDQKINDKELYNYSFGYGGAEALFTAEDCLSNTPNSVFPIFWWKKDIQHNNRKTLLTRHEEGF